MKKNLLLALILLISIRSFSQQLDTITFERLNKWVTIDTSGTNIWQIGKPSKILFDSAFSRSRAIVTDTLHYYPVNNKSSFVIKVGNFNWPTSDHNVFIEIKHRYDTDTLKDGGYIDVSFDNGLTWKNVNDPNAGNKTLFRFPYTKDDKNLYTNEDTLYNGEHGFSGRSDGWVTTCFGWGGILVKSTSDDPDTMQIRFNFISDNVSSQKEGWMIDNIRFFKGTLWGSVKSLKNLNFSLAPNPMDQLTTITLSKNYNKITLEVYSLKGQLLLTKNYTNQKEIVLNRENLTSGMYMVRIKADNAFSGQSKLVVK